MKFGMDVLHDHTKKCNSGLFCFLFFFGRNLVQSGRKNPKKVQMYLLKQKNISSKTANVTFFRMVMKNNPAKFRSPTPF